MPGMSGKQVEQFLEYLRTQIDHCTKERAIWFDEGRDEMAYNMKLERAGLEIAQRAFRLILEGRKP
jgi:hypothetical protein